MDSELSYEMLMEITSRASLQTLYTMRCMCKELNTLTYESYLLDLYKKRNNIVSGFLIQDTKSEWMDINEFAPSPDSTRLDLDFLPSNARILATSEQGIMVFHTPDPEDFWKDVYHVCKPATKQVLALPNLETKLFTVQKVAIVVMGWKPLRYKIIIFSDHPYYTTYSCDVFDSKTWEWRSLDHVIKLDDGVFLTNPQQPAITKSGSTYMLLTNHDILKFDAYSEEWEVFRSPISTSSTVVELVKYGGRLGVACKPLNAGGCWEILVLVKDELWEKVRVCEKKEGESGSVNLKALYDLDTSVHVVDPGDDTHTLQFYRFKQEEGGNMISNVVLNDIQTPACQMFSFRSDFEPIDLL